MTKQIGLAVLGLCSIVSMACHTTLAAHTAEATIREPGARELYLFMVAAVDRDCDGDLADEEERDRNFATQKTLAPAECIIYRTRYRNDGDFGIRHMRVTNIVPRQMIYIPGSAEHVSTPPGLWPQPSVMPTENEDGSLIWRFSGELEPGETGEIQFRVRLVP